MSRKSSAVALPAMSDRDGPQAAPTLRIFDLSLRTKKNHVQSTRMELGVSSYGFAALDCSWGNFHQLFEKRVERFMPVYDNMSCGYIW